MRTRAVTTLWAATAAVAAAGPTWTLHNPMPRGYKDEPIRLKIEVPADISPERYTVKSDGQAIPFQFEAAGDVRQVWVAATLSVSQSVAYAIEPGPSPRFEPMVKVAVQPDAIEMDNGRLAVRLPAKADGGVPCPVTQVRLPNGSWVGKGEWRTKRKLTGFSARVIGDGAILGKVRLRYDFEGKGGLLDETPSYYEADLTLEPGKEHLLIEESYAMGRDEEWVLDVAAGWAPRSAVVKPHFGGFGRPQMKGPDGNPFAWPPNTLKVGQTRMGDVLLNLHPRWSQAYDDGWMFAAADETHAVAAVVCRPGRWLWPHDSAIAVKVKESADYAGLHCPTRRGKRYWLLAAGPRENWQNPGALHAYVLFHAHEKLDKLLQEYILEWPGLKPTATNLTAEAAARWATGLAQYATRANAFVGWGEFGRSGFRANGHPINTLTMAQANFDPDMFGDYWLFWSPENPNFATSWIGAGFDALAEAVKYPGVREHPLFARMQRLAWLKAREEVYHSVTLPSGAGQECFGYMHRHSWGWRQDQCRERIGVDPDTRVWQEAAARFIFRASHPMPGGARKSHPGGDTHPPGPDVYEGMRHYGLKEDLKSLRTEELEGYGVIFRNNPGTPDETYLGFKSGPNRGHFHGDPLSFHYCAYGRPQVVDHHCSYGPRAGQEHMHNRLAFHTDTLPYANMDGYERLIAFKTSAGADMAIGQVESERLRIADPFPPERWDWELPQERFDKPLKYRRTVVQVKASGSAPDYFVFRDQYSGPDLYATYCLHVYGKTCTTNGSPFDFDPVRLTVAKPETFQVSRHDWNHSNGGYEETRGLRLTVKGSEAEFITVLMPKPLKRVSVENLVLKDAVQWDVRGRNVPAPVWKMGDLIAQLSWDGGKLLDTALVRVDGLHPAFVCNAGVSAVESNGEWRVTLRAQMRTRGFSGDGEYVLRVKRAGARREGSYDGTLVLGPGKAETKHARQGAVTGEWIESAASPLDLFADSPLPDVKAIPGGVRVGDDEIVFAGGLDDEEGTVYARVTRGGRPVVDLTGKDVDMNRSQGEIGLFVPDAGYPFGEIPDWLLRQRVARPSWYEEVWPPARAAARR